MKKKIIAVAFIALLTGTLMGCSNDTSTDMKSNNTSIDMKSNETSTDMKSNDTSIDEKSKDTYGYDEILSKIAASIESGEESDNGEYSYMYPKFGGMGASDFGYAFIQITENEQALVVGENGTNEYPSILYDMYEEKNGELVHIFSGGERDRYFATDTTGAFIEEGSSSADDSFLDTFIVNDGIRNSANFYRAPEKINIDLTSFKKQDSSENANIEGNSVEKNVAENKSSEKQSDKKKHSIEVTDDKGIVEKCPKSAKSGDKVTIKTNVFMDAIPEINVNGSDSGEWDKNRTEYTFIMPDEDVIISTILKSAGES